MGAIPHGLLVRRLVGRRRVRRRRCERRRYGTPAHPHRVQRLPPRSGLEALSPIPARTGKCVDLLSGRNEERDRGRRDLGSMGGPFPLGGPGRSRPSRARRWLRLRPGRAGGGERAFHSGAAPPPHGVDRSRSRPGMDEPHRRNPTLDLGGGLDGSWIGWRCKFRTGFGRSHMRGAPSARPRMFLADRNPRPCRLDGAGRGRADRRRSWFRAREARRAIERRRRSIHNPRGGRLHTGSRTDPGSPQRDDRTRV